MSTDAARTHDDLGDDLDFRALTNREIREEIREHLEVFVPRSSPWMGVASLWDFHGVLLPRVRLTSGAISKTVAESLADDWEAVARDLHGVVPSLEEDAELGRD